MSNSISIFKFIFGGLAAQTYCISVKHRYVATSFYFGQGWIGTLAGKSVGTL